MNCTPFPYDDRSCIADVRIFLNFKCIFLYLVEKLILHGCHRFSDLLKIILRDLSITNIFEVTITFRMLLNFLLFLSVQISLSLS